MKYVAAQSMGISADDAQARLEQLALVLPDLQSQLHTMHPSVLSALLQDVEAVAEKMLALRRLFPAANVSGMVCAQPRRFVTHSIERITRDKAALQALLGIDAVKADSIVERFPSFLDQQHVLEVLEEMGRFMGGTAEGLKATLANDPSWLLRVERGQQRLGINPDSQPGELADPPPGPGRAQGTNDNVGGGQIGGVDESAGDGGDNKQADDSAG